MTTSGTVELRSGTWTWNAIVVSDGESDEVSYRRLVFRLDGSPESKMEVLTPADAQLTPEYVEEVARSPEKRTWISGEGVQWDFRRKGRDIGPLAGGPPVEPPHLVAFRSDLGADGAGDLPRDVSLGEATDEELEAIIEQ